MSSTIMNITIEQGQTWNYDFLILIDPCSKVVDLSGKEIKMEIRKTYDGELIKTMSTDTGEIILTSGNWIGIWDESVDYVIGDIIKYRTLETEDYIYFICIADNTNQEPPFGCEASTSIYWETYRQVLFNLTSTDTADLVPRSYLYNLEILDNSVTPKIETKLLKGKFIIDPEVTL